jgi:hypothetical protein
MRSIFHEILSRYLDSDQYAFDASPRELWPEQSFKPRPETASKAASRASERACNHPVYRELEPQN